MNIVKAAAAWLWVRITWYAHVWWQEFWGGGSGNPYPGLTEAEFERYEHLAVVAEWRRLYHFEKVELSELEAKKDRAPWQR